MHPVSATEVFLLAMGIIFTVPYLIWRVLRTDYYAPLVVVQILAGILLGPGILGRASPDYYAFIFRSEVIAPLNGIAWWAVMLFVCVAGIELDLKRAWAHRKETVVTAALALGVPLLFGALVACGLLRYPGWAGTGAVSWQFMLGIGMACAVTALPILILLMEKLEILRNADAVYIDQIRKAGLYDHIWQAFAVLLPVRTVGVMGDGRTYDHVCALRAVTSTDGMTADFYPFDMNFLGTVATRIVNEVKGVNRVVYDVTSKPPGTIEWE